MDDRQAFSIISKYLQPNEKLLWHGAPNPWIAARKFIFEIIYWITSLIFNLLVLAFAIHDNGGSFVIITGLLVIFVYILWLFGIFQAILSCWKKGYGVTDQRLIIAFSNSNSIKSLPGASLAKIFRSGNDNWGTLRCSYYCNDEDDPDFSGFYGVKNPAHVEALIRKNLIVEKYRRS